MIGAPTWKGGSAVAVEHPAIEAHLDEVSEPGPVYRAHLPSG